MSDEKKPGSGAPGQIDINSLVPGATLKLETEHPENRAHKHTMEMVRLWANYILQGVALISVLGFMAYCLKVAVTVPDPAPAAVAGQPAVMPAVSAAEEARKQCWTIFATGFAALMGFIAGKVSSGKSE